MWYNGIAEAGLCDKNRQVISQPAVPDPPVLTTQIDPRKPPDERINPCDMIIVFNAMEQTTKHVDLMLLYFYTSPESCYDSHNV